MIKDYVVSPPRRTTRRTTPTVYQEPPVAGGGLSTQTPYAPHGHHPRYYAEFQDPGTDDSRLAQRKNQVDLDAAEKAAFRSAFDTLVASGAIGERVMDHRGPFQMHGNQRFLPWHRVFLKVLEDELQLIDPSINIPYWKWTEDRSIPDWIASWTPLVSLPAGMGSVQVTRTVGDISGALPDQGQIDTILGRNDFASFSMTNQNGLEAPHNTVHVVVGGSMGSVSTAPADPLFWMHHCEIDRIWASWQTTHANEHPNLAGSSAVMTPWSLVEEDTRTTEGLGYTYA